ncbi:MAG: efflux RND transporter periplasmic adaptor subunit, partial [Deltaproteobacteria bacterium]|nr:efflux RND transporter periplasmic adaptor subunit [Deltaproteobacteria bacterium]
EYELPWVREGMEAKMELSYIPGKVYYGKVLYIYPYLEVKTRTAKLRLQFANPGYQLKPNMYANIYLNSVVAKDSLVIPQEAVIDSGVRKVVFVSLGKGKFQPREIKLGVEGKDHEFQVLQGLSEGEKIVVSAQFMMDSESRLREAIQKMLEVRSGTTRPATEKIKDDDLDMSDIIMDNDLDMSDIAMDEEP